MNKQITVFGAVLIAAIVAPGAAPAAPHHNKGLTINATPNPNPVGDPVLVYGRLNLPSPGAKTIRLLHRVYPSGHFTLVGKTTTNALGFFEFTRTEGTVLTNRSWFVRGPAGTHSRTVHESVGALLTLAASTETTTTSQPIIFSGSISPVTGHVGEPVALQSLVGAAPGRWVTIATGTVATGATIRSATGSSSRRPTR